MKSALSTTSSQSDNRKVVAWEDSKTLRSTADAHVEVEIDLKDQLDQPLKPQQLLLPATKSHTTEFGIGFDASPIGVYAEEKNTFVSRFVKVSMAGARETLGMESEGDSLERRRAKQGNHRRIFRMSVITCYFFAVIVWVIYCFDRVQGKSSDFIKVNLAEDLYFSVQNCVLHIHVDHQDCDRYSTVAHPHCREGEDAQNNQIGYVWYTAYLPMKAVGDTFSFTHTRDTYKVSDSGLEGNWSTIVPPGEDDLTRTRNIFTLKNIGNVEMKACTIQFTLLHGANIGSLNIRCENDCVINSKLHAGDGEDFRGRAWTPTWSVRDSITIFAHETTEDKSGIMLSSFYVGFMLLIEINSGDVYLEDYEISSDTEQASIVNVYDGDFYGQLRGALRVLWHSSTAYSCFAGSSALHPWEYINDTLVSGGHSCPAYVSGATSEKSNTSTLILNDECIGTVLFCPAGGQRFNSTHCYMTGWDKFIAVPNLLLQVPRGSYYMSQRNQKSDKLPFLYTGLGFNETNVYGRRKITFDESSQLQFEKVKDIIGEKSNSDKAFVFQGPSTAVRLLRPSNAFVFAAMPSETYGQLRPWWMSFLSLSMLIHKIETSKIRMRAGPCPYRVATEKEKIGDIFDAIKELATPHGDDVDNALFYILDEQVEVGQTGNRPLDYEEISLDWMLFKDHGEKWWMFEDTADGGFVTTAIMLSDNTTLVAACIVSVIVSLICGSIGIYLAWATVSAITVHFAKAGTHTKRYDQMFQQSLENHDREGDVAKREGADLNSDSIAQFMKQQPIEARPQPNDTLASYGIEDLDGAEHDEIAQHLDYTSQFTFSKTEIAQTATKAVTLDLRLDVIPGETAIKKKVHWSEMLVKMRGLTIVPERLRRMFVKSQEEELDLDAQQKLNASGMLGGRVRLISIFLTPSMFCYVDHFATLARKRWFNSLADFLELTDPRTGLAVVRSVADSSEVNSVTYKEFRDVYSQFCFLLGRQEINLRTDSAKAVFGKYGLMSVQVSPNEQPFAFTRIRFKTQREREAIMHLPESQAQLATETSLDFFLRVECQRTSFDQEQIIMEDFNSRYKLFCENKRLMDQVAVSKATMAEKGINSMKVEAYRLVPFASGDKQLGKSIHLASARNHLEEIVRRRHGTMQQTKERLWWLQDLGVVTVHFMIVNIMVIPVNLPAFWLSSIYGQFSTRDDKVLFHWTDFKTEPYLVLFKAFRAFPILFFLFTIPGIIQWVSGFMELLSHYYHQQFPLDTLRAFKRSELMSGKPLRCVEKIKLGCGRKIMHVIQWVFFYVFVLCVSAGSAMVVIWMVLGALINPESFLAYATGAMTVVSFCLAKYSQCKQAFFKGWESIVNSLQDAMAKTMNETLRTIMNSDALDDIAGSVPGGEFLKHQVDVLAGSSLGKNIMSAGFDVEELVNMATGSKEALSAFAEKHGVPVEVLQIMFAFTEGSGEKVVAAIADLLRRFQDKSPVPAELATSLAELAFRPSPQKTQKCVDMLFQHGVKQILSHYLHDRIELQKVGSKVVSPVSVEITLSDGEGARAEAFLEKMGPSGVKLELLSIVRENAEKQIAEEMKQSSSSIQIFNQRIYVKVSDAWESLRLRVSAMTAEQLGIHEQVFSSMRDAVLAEIKALTRDPVAKEALASLIKAEVAHQLAEKARSVINEAAGLTQQNLSTVQGHLQNLLPPLLRGFVAMFADQDFQKFVESLRFVHQLVLAQKQLFGSIFGKDILQNLEHVAPLFHVLDLVLQTQQIPDAILGLLEEKSILHMPPAARQLIDVFLWMRDPSKKHRILEKEPHLLTSHRTKQTILKNAVKAFQLHEDFLIILEMLMSFALQDWRFFTFEDNAKKITKCISMLLENRIPQSSLMMMEECIQVSLIMLIATQVSIGPQMFEDCQKRVGLDNASRDDIINLFITKEVSPIAPPPHLEKSRLLEAAAEHVGLTMSEIVGLAHLLLGYTGTAKVAGLIRELLYRQNVMQLGVDKFITSILAIVFRKSDQAVTHGLDHLRFQRRFLTGVGLGMVKPGYVSEIMFNRAGIKNTDVLEKRFKVPFSIDEDTEVWREWLSKAEMAIKELPTHTSWKHPELTTRREFDAISNTMAIAENPDAFEGSLSFGSSNPPSSGTATGKFKTKLRSREKEERKAQRIRRAKVKLRKQRMKEANITQCEGVSEAGVATPASERIRFSKISQIDGEVLKAISGNLSGEESSSSDDQIDSDSDAQVDEHLDLMRRADIIQLRWLQGNLSETTLATLVDVFNHRDDNAKSDGFRLFEEEGGNRDEANQTLLEKTLAKAFNPNAKAADFHECHATRMLLQLQDLSTGKQKSLDSLRNNDSQMKIVLKILKLENVIGHSSHLREDALAGLRKEVVKNFAELLRLRDTRALNDFFDLMAPLETKKAKDAVGVFGKLFMPTRIAEAAQTMTYCVLRQSKIFSAIRERLWDVSWHFHLPRFLGPATLLPSIANPPTLKEIGSLFHFLLAYQLKETKISKRLQMLVFHLMRIHSTLPPPQDLMHELGMQSPSAKVGHIITVLSQPSASVKIQILPGILKSFLEDYEGDAQNKGLRVFSRRALPYIFFFAGFPFTELPGENGSRHLAAVTKISKDTGIRVEILQAIDISQRSVSCMSESDDAKFERESVLGLLAPLIESERIAQPLRSNELPTSSLVHSLCSLAYRKTPELEFLAESIQPIAMNAFVLELLVILTDLSGHARMPRYVETIMRRLRVNNDCAQALSDLGQNPQMILALLELSFPRLDDRRSIAQRTERLGLAEKLSVRVIELSYIISTCIIGHLEGVDDIIRHERATGEVAEALRPLYSGLGFGSEMIPLLATRLFHGDFSIVLNNNISLQHLLPYAIERDFTAGICGVLSHTPPEITYNPLVLNGALTLRLRKKVVKKSSAQVRADTPLPSRPEFSFRVICKKTQEDLLGAHVTLTRFDEKENVFHIVVDYEGIKLDIEETCVDVWWQCWSSIYSGPDELALAQWEQAKHALQTLESHCKRMTVSSTGVGHFWWKYFGIHPLFYLLANRNVGAIRLAAELLGIPDALLAFLLSIIFDVNGKDLDPLLFSDLCAEHIIGTSESGQVRIKRKRSKIQRVAEEECRIMDILGFSGHVGIDVDVSSSDEEDNEQDREVPCGKFDAEYTHSVEDFLRSMKDHRNMFPDQLLELYSTTSQKQESALNKIQQGLRAQWQFSTFAGRVQYACCNYTTFENVGIASLSQLRKEWRRPQPTVPDLVMEQAWADVPENTHFLLSTMLSSLDELVKEVNGENTSRSTYGQSRPPSVSVMVALSQLHQARENCCMLNREVRSSDVAESFERVTHAMQVHVRSSPALRNGLLKEFPHRLHECIWARGSVWGIDIPPDIIDFKFKDWIWEDWKWPKDDISDMFYRILAVARFALGISGKFEDRDASTTEADFRVATITPSKKKKSKNSKEDDIEATRWERCQGEGEDEVTKAKRKRMVQDVLNQRALPLVFAIAAGAMDPVNGNYNIRQVAKLHPNAKKIFDGTQELYDGMALLFSTRFDRCSPDSKSVIGSILRSKFPAPDKLGVRIAEWSRLLCWTLQLDSQTTTALFQVAHGLVEDDSRNLVLPEVLENFAVRLRLVKTVHSMQGAWSGGAFLQSLCNPSWTIASVEPLALRLGLSPAIVSAVCLSALGNVEGWIALHRFLVAPPLSQLPNEKNLWNSSFGQMKSAADAIKKSTQDSMKDLNVFYGAAAVPNTPAEEMAASFFNACEKFANMMYKDRGSTVQGQRDWMSQVLNALLPDLQKAWLRDLNIGRDGIVLFDQLIAFLLHILCNQNTAAVRVLVEEEKMAAAAAITEKEAVRLESFMLLCDTSVSNLDDKSMARAVDELVEPLVDYVMSQPPEDEASKSGVPDDEEFEDCHDPLEEQLKTRIKILLQAVFAISSENYKLLTRIVKVARALDLQQFIRRNEAVLCICNPETTMVQMRNFVVEPLQCDSEIANLIRQSVGMRSLVMLQSLNVLKEIHEKQEKHFGNDSNSLGNAKALSNMVRNLVNRTQEACDHQLQDRLKIAKEEVSDQLKVATNIAGIPEMQYGMFSIPEARPSLELPSIQPPIPPRQEISQLSLQSHLERSSACSMKKDRSSREATKVYNAMMHLFCAFVATDRGRITGLKLDQQCEFLQFMMDGDGNYPAILPAVAAIASGQLDLLFSHFLELARCSGIKKVMEDVALLENLVLLLGMNKEVFIRMVRSKHKFMSELISRALENFRDDRLQSVYEDAAKNKMLHDLLDGLMCVLLGYVVGAPPDTFAKSMDDLIKILNSFIRDMLSDQRTLNAGTALLDCAQKIALDMANGKTPDFWTGDPPMVTVLVDAALDLVAPFLASDLRKPLQYIIETLAQLTILQKDPSREGFAKQIPLIVKPLAAAFDVPPIFISGVVALAQADWKGAEELCMLFCNIDSDKLEQLTALLPTVMGVINIGDAGKVGAQVANSTGGKFFKSRMQQITNKLSTGNGDAADLFALTDIDGNGKISMEEFNMCMVRLGYKLLPSRVTEVFSKVKKDLTVQELNEREFKAALEYLQVSVASNTLSMLGKSWPRLLAWLAILTCLLVLVIVFIFLGMSAFTTGGTFSAIINSGMTIAAGLATFKKGATRGTDQEEKRQETETIEQVHDIIIQDQ